MSAAKPRRPITDPETEPQLGLPEQWQRMVRDWVASGFRGEVVAWEELDPDRDDRRPSQR
jgi:hypothetical protein